MQIITPTAKTKVRRHPERGLYDREVIFKILDEALVCHLGFVQDGHPVVIPTIYGRMADRLFIHGSRVSRMLQALGQGIDACVTVTLIDGLVLARSAFDHSMNYRSVVIFGKAVSITEKEEKLRALQAISDHVLPGRWHDVRQPTQNELDVTTVLSLPIAEASAKVRSGPPKDQAEDNALDVWAGVIPLRLVAGEPEADPVLKKGRDMPDYIKNYRRDLVG